MTEGTTPKTRHSVLILDKSGSMHSSRTAAINDYNENLQTAQRHAGEGKPIKLWCTVFSDADQIGMTATDLDPRNAPELTLDTYIPNGSTALFDAIAHTVRHVEEQTGGTGFYKVDVITDGEENASVNYARGRDGLQRLQSLLERLKATERWTFSFLCGSLEQAHGLQKDFQVARGNVASFNSADGGKSLRAASMARSAGNAAFYCASEETLCSGGLDNLYGNGEVVDYSQVEGATDQQEGASAKIPSAGPRLVAPTDPGLLSSAARAANMVDGRTAESCLRRFDRHGNLQPLADNPHVESKAS